MVEIEFYKLIFVCAKKDIMIQGFCNVVNVIEHVYNVVVQENLVVLNVIQVEL